MTVPETALTEPTGNPDGPLIVLGHSLGTGPLIWEKVVPLLEPAYRVTLLSLPGHGSAPVPSDAFTIEELADATAARVRDLNGGEGAFYAGVSIGGASPSRSGCATPTCSQPSSKRWFAPESFVTEPDLTGRILRVLQGTSDEGYARCAEALASYDLRGALGDIRVPVLAMGGAADGVAPEDRQDEIIAAVPRAYMVMIASAAHQPPAEQPAAVAAALLDFFGGLA